MKIAYVITQGECGGAQRNVLDVAVAMRRAGHDVFVCTGQQKSTTDGWLFTELSKNSFLKSKLVIFNNLVREINPICDLKNIYEIAKFTKREKINLVHLHSTKAGIFGAVGAKIAGAKVVYTVHGFVFTEKIFFFKKIIYLFFEFIASFFRDLTITVSEFDMKIGKKYGVIRPKKGIVIYNGIHEVAKKELLSKEASIKFLMSKANVQNNIDIIIGTVANLYKNKGINYLIDAAKIVLSQSNQNILFIVIGEGEERYQLEEQIKKNALENSFALLGSIPNAFKFLRGFKLVVLPSTKEGFPYILIETMLAGTPFVATEVGGVRELTRYSISDLIPPGDAGAIAEAILSALAKKNFIPPNLPEIFTTNVMLRKLQHEYTQLTKQKEF